MIYMNVFKVSDLPHPAQPLPSPSPEVIGDFYVRFGMAIAAWQFIEGMLISLYGTAVGSPDSPAIQASFHIPVNFSTRIDMVNAALQRCNLDADALDEWNKLYRRARDNSKRRNAVAHSQVIFDSKEDRLFLSQNPMNPLKGGLDDTISKKNLEDMIQSFDILYNDLHSFYIKYLRSRYVDQS